MHRFQFKAYRRRFSSTFANARDRFVTREGLIVRVEDKDGRVGFGEAAPLPSFGTESFPAAVAAATVIGDRFEWDETGASLKGFPSLRWGIESALEASRQEAGSWPGPVDPWPVCRLIDDWTSPQAVEAALDAGYRSLKFKIGRSDFEAESRAAIRAAEQCEGRATLRFDANGSLDLKGAKRWLEVAAELPVEFLEQAMPPGCEDEMMRLADDYPTPLALDESVCQVDQLKRWRDRQWRGIFVLKASLSGSREELRAELQQGACDCVFSSSLETVVGAASALALAVDSNSPRRPLGFGVQGIFGDQNVSMELGPFLPRGPLPGIDAMQKVWNRI